MVEALPFVLMIKSIIFFLSVFYFGLHIFGEGGARAYLIFIATAPRELAFPMRIIQAVFSVAIFFFVGVYISDPP